MIEVAAAIIEDGDGRLLIARRKQGKSQEGLWEFPGGKLEPGETAESCLVRELQEEMSIRIRPYVYFGVNEHRYEAAAIRLIAYKAVYGGGDMKLADHDDCRWITRGELGLFHFAPADVPFVEKLKLEPELQQQLESDKQ
ncbi:(deoxy)nucleoside triphosphate pyrophosphohydrolase [Paenibacillus protaetiae]|uniref:8-oxo-dGTP diphosphatase n=1 Tax=Paenibacillus protaetiae TaxID=2509456 RepID=A0A4P6EXM2_9BACL|nr:(deoxy)nucleoside triphosphate pyrophosphohydrolase [Paenibacillus protaetiae]QAY66993.1 (deoxy)nucleoside triphosphate pyrophosphohydrolase [Paenibacillus protaetiae]